ncbi:hypothetical protein J6590_028187 [Homalodisca vitripennis]|nr:hypothetical protein J6590_028186 [Homalodisca vitripennis]KAG8327043.1 hypothetical protein J6590_028187 [Homalodisca vitripennis]
MEEQKSFVKRVLAGMVTRVLGKCLSFGKNSEKCINTRSGQEQEDENDRRESEDFQNEDEMKCYSKRKDQAKLYDEQKKEKGKTNKDRESKDPDENKDNMKKLRRMVIKIMGKLGKSDIKTKTKSKMKKSKIETKTIKRLSSHHKKIDL